MRKILVLVLVLSVFLLCACQNGNNDETQPVSSPTESEVGAADPSEKATIDWETPIDVDDSFAEETDAPTEPSETSNGATEPSTEPSVKPTEDPTETADPGESPTEAVQPTEPVPTKPFGSGPIELPMVPG